ncbi:MAG TPA: hypothetical protein VIJ34_08220 [Acidimicrobiales bacterium]
MTKAGQLDHLHRNETGYGTKFSEMLIPIPVADQLLPDVHAVVH